MDLPGRVRTNITLTEPDGTTTKINEPGALLDDDAQLACLAAVRDAVSPGDKDSARTTAAETLAAAR